MQILRILRTSFFSLTGILSILLLVPLSVIGYWKLFLPETSLPGVEEKLLAQLSDGTVRPPIVLVHGLWGGGPNESSECAAQEGPVAYSTLLREKGHVPLGQLGQWLVEDGYEPYYVFLASKPDYTTSLAENGRCLEQQMRNLVGHLGDKGYTIIAHSMGGLVARVCLAQSEFCRAAINRLITLGSPHNGSPAFYNLKTELADKACMDDPGLCSMADKEQNRLFNSQTPNQPKIDYVFIGGNQGIFNGALYLLHENDGVVSSWSAIGMLLDAQGKPSFANWVKPNPPTVYFTQNKHSVSRREGYAYYQATLDGNSSDAYACIRYELGKINKRPDVCQDPPERSLGKHGIP